MPTPLSNRLVHLEIRVRREVGESLVGACVRREPALQRSPAFIRWGGGENPVKGDAMYWWVTHHPAGNTPTRKYAVRAPSLDAARRKLAAFLDVPVWTLR